MQKNNARKIYSLLLKRYPDPSNSPATLGRGSPFEVLILTILSAQTTDRAVLKVKKPLLKKYPFPEDLAKAKIKDLEKIIHSLGFYHVKAQHIIAAAQKILSDFDGIVPQTMEALVTLPGVGRKTANIVLYHALGTNEGIAVDTHVRRLAQRIGLSDHRHQDKIEQDLMQVFPQKHWGDVTDILIAHGRACCTAKKPQCEICPIVKYCRYFRTAEKQV